MVRANSLKSWSPTSHTTQDQSMANYQVETLRVNFNLPSRAQWHIQSCISISLSRKPHSDRLQQVPSLVAGHKFNSNFRFFSRWVLIKEVLCTISKKRWSDTPGIEPKTSCAKTSTLSLDHSSSAPLNIRPNKSINE